MTLEEGTWYSGSRIRLRRRTADALWPLPSLPFCSVQVLSALHSEAQRSVRWPGSAFLDFDPVGSKYHSIGVQHGKHAKTSSAITQLLHPAQGLSRELRLQLAASSSHKTAVSRAHGLRRKGRCPQKACDAIPGLPGIASKRVLQRTAAPISKAP